MGQFTFEEINFICCYRKKTRADTVAAMTAALPYMDKDIQDIAKQAISKLENNQDVDLQELLNCEITD